MKKLILIFILIFATSLFAQSNRTTTETQITNWQNSQHHAYLNFADSAVTITATRNVWYTVVGTNDSIWGEIEVSGLTSENDTLYLGKDGDYEGDATVYFIGANNDTYQGQVKHNSLTLVKTYNKIAGDTTDISMDYYLGGSAGDTVIVQIRNTKNNNDPILLGGTHKIFFVHD